MKKSITKLLVGSSAMLVPFLALAQAINAEEGLGEALDSVIDFINTAVLPFVFAIAVLVLIWGIFQFVTSGGDDEKLSMIGRALQQDADSPFCGLIRMNDAASSVATLSLAHVVLKLRQFIATPAGAWFRAMDGFGNRAINTDVLVSVLKQYFRVIKELQLDDWGSSDSVLTKTLGFGALMKLMPDVVTESRARYRSVDENSFRPLMAPLNTFDFSSNEVGSLGGEKGQCELKERILDHLDLRQPVTI